MVPNAKHNTACKQQTVLCSTNYITNNIITTKMKGIKDHNRSFHPWHSHCSMSSINSATMKIVNFQETSMLKNKPKNQKGT